MSDSAPHKPRVWTSYLAFVVAAISVFAASMALIGTIAAQRYGARARDSAFMARAARELVSDPLVLAMSVVTTSSIFALVALAGAMLSPERFAARLLLRPLPRPAVVIVAMLGAPALGQFLDSLVTLLDFEPSGSLKMLGDAISNLRGAKLVLLSLAISCGPGLGEELLFRGYLQSRFTRRYGPWLGISLASVLFGLAHFDRMHSPLAALLGAYLGFLAYRFKTLWIGVAAHWFNNLVATLSSAFLPESAASTEGAWAGLGVGALLFAAALWFLLRAQLPSDSDPPSGSESDGSGREAGGDAERELRGAPVA